MQQAKQALGSGKKWPGRSKPCKRCAKQMNDCKIEKANGRNAFFYTDQLYKHHAVAPAGLNTPRSYQWDECRMKGRARAQQGQVRQGTYLYMAQESAASRQTYTTLSIQRFGGSGTAAILP